MPSSWHVTAAGQRGRIGRGHQHHGPRLGAVGIDGPVQSGQAGRIERVPFGQGEIERRRRGAGTGPFIRPRPIGPGIRPDVGLGIGQRAGQHRVGHPCRQRGTIDGWSGTVCLRLQARTGRHQQQTIGRRACPAHGKGGTAQRVEALVPQGYRLLDQRQPGSVFRKWVHGIQSSRIRESSRRSRLEGRPCRPWAGSRSKRRRSAAASRAATDSGVS